MLFPHAQEVIFTQPATPRAVSARQLAEMAGDHAKEFTVIEDAEQALESALAKAGPEDAVFITGSLYLVGELRHAWKARRKSRITIKKTVEWGFFRDAAGRAAGVLFCGTGESPGRKSSS